MVLSWFSAIRAALNARRYARWGSVKPLLRLAARDSATLVSSCSGIAIDRLISFLTAVSRAVTATGSATSTGALIVATWAATSTVDAFIRSLKPARLREASWNWRSAAVSCVFSFASSLGSLLGAEAICSFAMSSVSCRSAILVGSVSAASLAVKVATKSWVCFKPSGDTAS